MKTVLRLVACLAVLAGTVVWAENLNNDSVIQLHKLGLGDSVIVEKIKGSTCQFDTSVGALKGLKDVGLSDAVIQAMIAAGSPSSGPTAAAAAAAPAGDPNDPTAPHQSGIYLYETIDGKPRMTQMKPSPIDEVKTGSGFGVGWGGSAKSRAILPGLHASMQLAESQPVFYFYFDKEAEGLSSTGSSATTPDDFSLAVMDLHKDKQERRLEIGKYTMGGSRIGLNKKDVQALNADKVADRVFKVTPVNSLKTGRIRLR